MRKELQRLTLLALLTALCVVLRLVKIPIPNVQPVTDIIMITTLFLGLAAGCLLAGLTMFISNIYLGFGIWTLPQILAYIVCALTVVLIARLFNLKKKWWLQLIVATFLGYEYGFFVSLGMTIFGGWAAFWAYWLSGLLFDSYHAAGNLVFYIVLYQPLSRALQHYLRRSN
jgi:energy-coupling factor transport system substrate-specific component